jgi:UrcA family protein
MRRAAVALGLGVALAAGSAGAQGSSVRMARVPFGDLDLATARGAQTLLHRLSVAAKAMCATAPRTPLLPHEAGRADRCRRDAVAAAVERLNRPQLTVAYAQVVPAAP